MAKITKGISKENLRLAIMKFKEKFPEARHGNIEVILGKRAFFTLFMDHQDCPVGITPTLKSFSSIDYCPIRVSNVDTESSSIRSNKNPSRYYLPIEWGPLDTHDEDDYVEEEPEYEVVGVISAKKLLSPYQGSGMRIATYTYTVKESQVPGTMRRCFKAIAAEEQNLERTLSKWNVKQEKS